MTSKSRSQVGYVLIRGRTSAQIKTLRPFFLTLSTTKVQNLSKYQVLLFRGIIHLSKLHFNDLGPGIWLCTATPWLCPILIYNEYQRNALSFYSTTAGLGCICSKIVGDRQQNNFDRYFLNLWHHRVWQRNVGKETTSKLEIVVHSSYCHQLILVQVVLTKLSNYTFR